MIRITLSVLVLFLVAGAVVSAQKEDLPPGLKDAVLHDAVCTKPADTASPDTPSLNRAPILAGGRELGTIVSVQGTCHCQGPNCDVLVYLRKGEAYELALHEKYAS